MLQRIQRERRGRRVPTLSRWGGLGALAAAALLVALFAGLLAHQAARRPTPGATSTVARTATSATTPTVTPAAWTVVPGYQGVINIGIAPSDPRVAYQLWDGGTPLLFRRTDDQGTTWHALTLPNIPDASYPVIGAASYVEVNPLDPHVAYLNIDASMHAPITICSSNGGGESAFKDPLCRYQYISTDSGAHWQSLALPLVGDFGALQGQRDAGAQPGAARLYATLTPMSQGASDRLVRSDDNGVSWQLVDAPIVAADQRIFNFAATPTGSTIFALSEAAGAQPASSAPLTIWSSDDAGATWTNLGPAPSDSVLGMTAGLVASSGKSMLYLLTTSLPASQGEIDIQGSLFGASGSFHIAPTPPQACTSFASSSLLGARADGSVIVWCGGALQSWLAEPAGAQGSDWQTLTQDPATSSIRSAFMQTLPDGSERLWLITFDTNGAKVEYATLPN
jgi:hypothetical protein